MHRLLRYIVTQLAATLQQSLQIEHLYDICSLTTEQQCNDLGGVSALGVLVLLSLVILQQK